MIVPHTLLRDGFWRYYQIVHYRIAVDNTTLDEVTTMITDFNPNLANFYPTLAVVITSIDDVVKEYINYFINLHAHMSCTVSII